MGLYFPAFHGTSIISDYSQGCPKPVTVWPADYDISSECDIMDMLDEASGAGGLPGHSTPSSGGAQRRASRPHQYRRQEVTHGPEAVHSRTDPRTPGDPRGTGCADDRPPRPGVRRSAEGGNTETAATALHSAARLSVCFLLHRCHGGIRPPGLRQAGAQHHLWGFFQALARHHQGERDPLRQGGGTDGADHHPGTGRRGPFAGGL